MILKVSALLGFILSVNCQTVEEIKLSQHFKEINLTKHSTSWIFTEPEDNDKFLLFESHSVVNTILMSTSPSIDINKNVTESESYVNSTDPAVVVMLDVATNDTRVGVYIINNHHQHLHMLARVTSYQAEDPVPGWCSNSKTGVWPRPGLSIAMGQQIVKVNFSLAATEHGSCNNRDEVQYQVYHRYLESGGWSGDHSEEELFRGLQKFQDIESIQRYGTPVASLGPHIDRLVFAAYQSTGSVYAVLASTGNGSSVYGLGHSYGCYLNPVTGDCVQSSALTLIQVFSACTVFAGLMLAFVGHKYFLGSQIVFGFYAGIYVGYILLSLFCSLGNYFFFILMVACGVCFAIITVALWIFLGIPVLSVLLPTLEVGVLLASVILYLPQTNTMSLTFTLHYWLVFICLVLAVPVCILAFTHKAHIIACVLVGTTLVVLPVDFYMKTSLRFVFLNVLRRSYTPEFREAILVPVFQSGELILLACWLALAAVALLCQLLVQRKKPPFPPSPFQQWRWRREASRDENSETEPLLVTVDNEEESRVARPAVVGYIQGNRVDRVRAEVQRKPRDVFTPSAPEDTSY